MGLRDRASLRAGWFCSLVKLLSVFYHVGKNEAEISWGVWEVGGVGPVTSAAVLALTFDLAIAKYVLRVSSCVNIYRSLTNNQSRGFFKVCAEVSNLQC